MNCCPTNPTKEQIVKCNHGISSYYYPLNNGWGIKFFKSKRERDYSRYHQNIANLAGLAPKAGKEVYSDGFWGYLTEHVKMLHDIYVYKSMPKSYKKKMDNLIDDLLQSCDFSMDNNFHNFGVDFSGKIVCVDFGFHDSYSY